MLTPSEDSLKKLGYVRYDTLRRKLFCDFFYQRKITDSRGTRYFVEFWHYPLIPVIPAAQEWLFEVNLNEPHCTLQIHRPTTIEFCELRASAFWRMMGAIYYEETEQD